ncbi:DB module [Ancylostoma ceylanicum]|uniref:DB module n=1 Tax=Ancylostoma ceylanicum TaxID=53326 RepID=A0A0D6LRP8_9BILA|nr:DB module [Ancylostoma ceylanicum]
MGKATLALNVQFCALSLPSITKSKAGNEQDGIFISEERGTTPPPDSREVDLEERNIFGLSRGAGKPAKAQSIESRERPDNVTIHRLTNPNFIFRQCCEQRGLPDACLDKCHFNAYTRNAATNSFDNSMVRITKLDYSYVPCYDRFEQMKQCFYNEIREKASRQYGSR